MTDPDTDTDDSRTADKPPNGTMWGKLVLMIAMLGLGLFMLIKRAVLSAWDSLRSLSP